MSKSFKLSGKLLSERGPRRNIQLALIALVALDLVFYLFAIGPLADSDREKRLLVENLRRQVKERTAQVDKLAALTEKVQNARTDGDDLLEEITMPRRTAYSTLVSELDQAGKKAGVELKDRGYNIDPIEGSDTLSMMTVNAKLDGNYENLVRFLNLLDRSEQFFIIENLGAAPHQTGTLLSVSLKLDAFVREM